MVASNLSDIPESKVDFCPCNRCSVARKQGKQEAEVRVTELLNKISRLEKQIYNAEGYCEISKKTCGICPMKQLCIKTGQTS
jgi:endonuclease III